MAVTRILALLISSFFCSVSLAQSPTTFSWQVVRNHELLPHPSHLVEQSATNSFPPASVPLKLTVSPAGAVTAVELGHNPYGRAPDPSTYNWQAVQQLALQWKFIPFATGGKPVTASIDEWVTLVGPRREPTRHVDPPALRPDSNIVITLERTPCLGTCPAYKLTIDPHSIRYQGVYSTVVEGPHHDTPDPAAVRRLAQRFVDAGFYSLDDKYILGVTDGTTCTLSISIDGRTKSVTDYGGINVGMPLVVSELEDAADILARSGRWVRGHEGLVQNLKAEGFDFHTADAQSILARVIEHDQARTVEELLQSGVPLEVLPDAQAPTNRSQFDPTVLHWLTFATNSPAVMPVLLAARVSEHDQQDKDSALQGAAGFGDLEMVRALINYGANPDAIFTLATPPRNVPGLPPQTTGNGSVLTRAAASGNPEVVREILAHHPILEAKDSNGRTAIFAAAEGRFTQSSESNDRVECLKLLAAAGANPNARDNQGDTALWVAATNNVRQQLLNMGIDINARNNDGDTVLFHLWDANAVTFLIQHGLDVNIRNHFGEDAIQSYQRRHIIISPEMKAAIEKAAGPGPWR